MKVVTLCLNPTLQKTLVYDNLKEGEVNRTDKSFIHPSGKGLNVSRSLTQRGIRNVHLTHGGGQFASFLKKLCRDEGIALFLARSHSEIRWCTTLIDLEKDLTTELVEESTAVGKNTPARMRKLILRKLDRGDILTISGSKTSGYKTSFFKEIIQGAKEKDCRIITDFRGEDLLLALEASPDVAKMNMAEFLDTFFNTASSADRVQRKMLEIKKKYTTEILITQGSQETLYTLGDKVESLIPAKIRPLNTTGCGDSFTAGLAAALFLKKAWKEAVVYAQNTASLSAETLIPGSLK